MKKDLEYSWIAVNRSVKIIVLKGDNALKVNVIVMKDFKEMIVVRRVVKAIVVLMDFVMMGYVNVLAISMESFAKGEPV